MVCLLAEAEHGRSDVRNIIWYVCWQKQSICMSAGRSNQGEFDKSKWQIAVSLVGT